jgi:hypothetical protein
MLGMVAAVAVTDSEDMSSGTGIISRPVAESLDLVPHHRAIPEIERLTFPGIPYLTSVHCVTRASANEDTYCQPHEHEDQDELNVFLGTTDDFRFRITLDGSDHILGPTAAVLIPAGTDHAANVLSGSGFYVVFKIFAEGT